MMCGWRIGPFAFVSATALLAQNLEMRTVSGKPEMVTGGHSLIEVTGPGLDKLKLTLNGQDVTNSFRPGKTAGTLIGKVEGLKPGSNTLEAKAASKHARLVLMNHPITARSSRAPTRRPSYVRLRSPA
jgi:hypothetical protein